MPKRSYAIKVNGQTQYRMFPSSEEANRYSNLVFRGNTVVIEQKNEYPNSQFINNRALNVRKRHL